MTQQAQTEAVFFLSAWETEDEVRETSLRIGSEELDEIDGDIDAGDFNTDVRKVLAGRGWVIEDLPEWEHDVWSRDPRTGSIEYVSFSGPVVRPIAAWL